ncbi:MAG: carboxypeptidase regulatory-like domain-containing protein [Candidatus Kapabacteria bacterium]|nr:carboxypeptidase regulatory-like domain-containing protein [Candidatus Kapabacteria bacterium]
MKNLIICLLAALALYSCSDSESNPSRGKIEGQVIDTKYLPVENVLIQTVPASQSTLTDINGNFTFDQMDPGEYRVTAYKFSYPTGAENIKVNAGLTTNMVIILDSSAINNSGDTLTDSYTKLLLHFNNNLTDSSGNNYSVTDYSTTDNATYFKFGGHSRYFSGSGSSYLQLANSPNFDFGAGDFTIDFWLFPTSVTHIKQCVIYRRTSNVYTPWQFEIGTGGLTYDGSTTGSSWDINITGPSLALNAWSHIALVRYGATITMYLNGSSVGTPVNIGSKSLFNNSQGLSIGDIPMIRGISVYPFVGYMDEIRISKGIARWTTNFTTPDRQY